jgi:hypothetical protein
MELEDRSLSENGRLTPALADGCNGSQPAAVLGEC